MEAATRLERLWTALFWLCLLAYVCFVLSLPLFPTGDGPLHIYLANVFWQVVTHPHGSYAQYYAVRHLVQPYSLHYYFLIGFGHWLSANMAEKLFVLLIFATMATGFRALCRAFSPQPGAVALWVFPLLLSWPLGAGLLNFTLAAGLMLWGLAAYYRIAEHPRSGLAGFALVTVLLVLAHPVPLLLLIAFLAADLLQRSFSAGGRRQLVAARVQPVALAIACAGFLIPLLLADKAQVANSVAGDVRFHWIWLLYIISGLRIGLMYRPDLAGGLYLGLLVALLPGTVALAMYSGWQQRLRGHNSRPADRLLASALVALLLSLWLPEHMNGSALFADRMWLLLWLAGSASAAAMVVGRRMQIGVAVLAIAAAALSLGLAIVCLRPIALEQQRLTEAPLPNHASGIFLEAGSPGDRLCSRSARTTTYPLNYWAGTRDFFPHQDVLLNTPWMNLTILPLRTRAGGPLLGPAMPGALIENPMDFSAALTQHRPAAEQAAAKADFILYFDPYTSPGSALGEARQMLAPQSPAWSCTGQPEWALCEHRQAR